MGFNEKDNVIKYGGFLISEKYSDKIVFASNEVTRLFGHDLEGMNLASFFQKDASYFSLNSLFHEDETSISWDPGITNGILAGCKVSSDYIVLSGKGFYLSRIFAVDNQRDVFQDLGRSSRAEAEKEALSQVIAEFANSEKTDIDRFKDVLKIILDTFQAESVICLIHGENKPMLALASEKKTLISPELNQALISFSQMIWKMSVEETENSFHTPDFIDRVLGKLDVEDLSYKFFNNRQTYLYTLRFSGLEKAFGNLFIMNPKVPLRQDGFLKLVANILVFSYGFSSSLSPANHGDLSLIDSLTGVKNANAYALCQAKAKMEKASSYGVLFADINGLKYTNDHYGHAAGDSLIVATVNILRKYFSPNDIYRIGGDEFVTILPNIIQREFDNVAQKVRNELNENDTTYASLGAVFGEKEKAQLENLVQEADKAMYQDKEGFYASIQVHPEKYDSIFIKSLKDEVTEAVLKGTFTSSLTPRFDEPSHLVIGFDAKYLLKEKIAGIDDPNQFVSEMESIGAGPLAAYTLFKVACIFQRNVLDKYGATVPIYVNFTVSSLKEKNFAQSLKQIADEYKLPHDCLGIQFINIRFNDDDSYIPAALAVHEAGFKLSVNHFGYGNAPLWLLNSLPLDSAKLSGTYQSLLGTEAGYTVLSGLRSLCYSLNVPLVFDKIKTQEQYDKVLEYGFRYLRGPYLEKEMTMDEVKEKYYVEGQKDLYKVFAPSFVTLL